jgi:hypothetical protein
MVVAREQARWRPVHFLVGACIAALLAFGAFSIRYSQRSHAGFPPLRPTGLEQPDVPRAYTVAPPIDAHGPVLFDVYGQYDDPDMYEPTLIHVASGVVHDRSVRCIGNLCIGSAHGASNYAALDAAGVTHVVSAIGTCSLRSDGRPCLDLELEDASFPENAGAMLKALRLAIVWRLRHTTVQCMSTDCPPPSPLPRVFVHCSAGVSRSAALVIGYMLEDAGRFTHSSMIDFSHNRLGYDAALALLREARAVVRPNPVFELTLRVAATVGLGPDAECTLRYILYTRKNGHPCTCNDEETCTVADLMLCRHADLVQQIWGIAKP